MISARFTVIRSNPGLKTHCHVLWIIWSSEQQCICQTFDRHFHHEGEVQMRDQYPLFDSRALIAWTQLCKPVKSMSTESSNWKFSFTRTRFHCWSNSVTFGSNLTLWKWRNFEMITSSRERVLKSIQTRSIGTSPYCVFYFFVFSMLCHHSALWPMLLMIQSLLLQHVFLLHQIEIPFTPDLIIIFYGQEFIVQRNNRSGSWN